MQVDGKEPAPAVLDDEAESEARYRGLFENLPISLWEQDLSKIKEYLDGLCDSGVTDLGIYFDEHPEAIAHCAALARVIDVNQATLDLFKAETIEQLLGGLGTVFTDDSYAVLKKKLIALAQGATKFKSEAVHRTVKGDDLYVAFYLAVAPGYENSWARVFVSIIDITEHREAEEILRKSEERYRALFERTHDAVFIMDLDGTYLAVNQKAAEMLGYTTDEMVGLSVQQLVAPHEYPDSQKSLQAILKGELLPVYERTLEHKDGTKVPVEINVALVYDASGKPLHIQSIVRDITERKQTEEALRESEERYRLLFELSPESVTLLGLDGIVIDCNEATSGISGLPREEMIGQSYMELDMLNQDDMPKYAEIFSKLVSGEQVESFELVITRGNDPRWIEVFPALLTKDNVPHAIQIITRDVTEPKLARAERDRLLQDLMRRSNQLVTASQVSKSASTLLDPEELMEKAVTVIQTRFDFYYVGLFLVDDVRGAPGEYAVLRAGSGAAGRRMLMAKHKLLIGGESMIGQCVATAQARIALDVGEEAVRFDNPHLPDTRSEMALPLISRGQCIGALSVQSTAEAAFSPGDVTILQTMADQLAIAIANAHLYDQVQRYATTLEDLVVERTTELAAVNRELESFAYSVSHDLRAPLRSIDGFGQALLEDYGDQLDAVGQDYLERVRAASQRMGRLIDDLLTLSRMTRREMIHEQVNLSALVQTVAAELEQRDPDRQVELIVAEDVFATGDPQLLRVVLENLLGNAWKFTSKHSQARIEFGVIHCEGKPVYFVRDDGAGFDMTYADKLFGAFQRLHSLAEFEGTGIGLATVQRIIHRHNGRVWAEAEVEKGATFYFTL